MAARSRPALVAVLSAAALIASPAFAHATEAHHDDGGLELWRADVSATQLNTSNATFEGWGTHPDNTPGHFSATGHQIGAAHPWVFAFGLHPTAMPWRHITLGASFEMGGGASDGPQDPVARDARIGTNLTFLRAGADAGTVWAIGPVELRASLGVGVRTLSAPILAFQPSPCKGGRCFPPATALEGYLQPRVTIAVDTGYMFTLGIFAGVDVLPDLSPTVGAFLGAHLPGWNRRAQIGPERDEPDTSAQPAGSLAHSPSSVAPEVHIANSIDAPPPDMVPSCVPDIPSVTAPAPTLAPTPEPDAALQLHVHIDSVNHILTVTTPDGTVTTPLPPPPVLPAEP
jgi:hypothetical protein